MANTSIVKLADLEVTKRIDPEYYDPFYIKIENQLWKTGMCKAWKELDGSFVTGPFGSEFNVENYVNEGPYRYIRGKDVKDFFLLENDNVYLPKKDFERMQKHALKKGDVLISVVGTIGNSIVVDEQDTPSIFSCKSTAFRSETINPFYLISYLHSKFGKSLLIRRVRGTVQTGLNIDDLKAIPIFSAPSTIQEQVGKIVIQARTLLRTSRDLYKQAINALLLELGQTDLNLKQQLYFTADLSNVLRNKKMDSEYFQPAHVKLERHLINKLGSKPIGQIDYIDVITGQYFDIYVDKTEGRPYIRGTDLSNGTVELKSLVYISPKIQIESKKAKEGDVVITRVGSIGLSGVIPSECSGGTISDNLIRLRFDRKYLEPYYVGLYLDSPIGQSLMIRNSRGSVQQRLNQETLKEVVIPELDKDIQKKLAALVIKSHSKRTEANVMLSKAKETVETYIENKLT